MHFLSTLGLSLCGRKTSYLLRIGYADGAKIGPTDPMPMGPRRVFGTREQDAHLVSVFMQTQCQWARIDDDKRETEWLLCCLDNRGDQE